VDETERVRATRVEVSRLSALRYRERLNEDQQAIVEREIAELVATLPQVDQASYAEEKIATFGIELDWSILENDRVERALEYAVCSVVRQWGGEKLSATEDDLTQAGRIILAEKADKARKELAKGGFPYLQRWIWQRLTDLIKYEHRDGSLDEMRHFIEDGDTKYAGRVWMDKPYHRDKWK
jgi:hypothetical protein